MSSVSFSESMPIAEKYDQGEVNFIFKIPQLVSQQQLSDSESDLDKLVSPSYEGELFKLDYWLSFQVFHDWKDDESGQINIPVKIL